MSCNNNCGIRGMNFLPAAQSAQDCFCMLKAAQVFNADFSALQATVYIDEIIQPTGILPEMPYQLISARSRAIPVFPDVITLIDTSGIMPFGVIPGIPHCPLHSYQVAVTVPMEIFFKDATDTQFRAYGHANLLLEITTHLTYEELCDSGIAVTFPAFDAVSGTFVSAAISNLTLCGSIEFVFLCPSLLRLNYEGECSFRSPPGESMVVSPTPVVI